MPLRIHSLVKVVALCAEMAIHTGLFALITSALLAQKAGAYGALQFVMDATVMFAIVIIVPLKKKHEDEETSRIINVVGFSAIFLLSLTGAGGLTIRATSGSNFCEEFSSGGSGRCGEARLAVAMSWTSVVIAIAGVLVSWLDKHPGAAEAIKLYAPQRSVREIELLKQRPTSTPTKAAGSSPHSRPHTTRPSSGPPEELAEIPIDLGPLPLSPPSPERAKRVRYINATQDSERAVRTVSEEEPYILVEVEVSFGGC